MLALQLLQSCDDTNIIMLERGSPTRVAGGQAIAFGPNAVKILDNLGFDRKFARAVIGKGMKSYHGTTGALVKKIPLNIQGDYNSDWFMNMRKDARNELLRLATEKSSERGVDGPTLAPRYETEVSDIDPEEGTVVLMSGEIIHADLVIVAAGIHSSLRGKILGQQVLKPIPTGQTVFRFLFSAENSRKAFGSLHEWWNPEEGGFLSIVRKDDGTNRAIITYPRSDFSYANFTCAFPSSYLKLRAEESWFSEGDLDEALESFKDFAEYILNLMQYAEEPEVWELRDHDPLPRYVCGRAVLIGDATHSMAPFQGQGASQAIEDAEGFNLLLEPNVCRDAIPAILKQWERARRPRASQVQLNTRAPSTQLNEIDSFKNMAYNWTYNGITEALADLRTICLSILSVDKTVT